MLDVRPIPSATCTSQTRDEVPGGAFFLLFQKGLAAPSDFWRLAFGSETVSERPASLSTRPSPKLRRIQKVSHFQHVVESELRRS
jgi:hypothetical protein